MRIGYGLRSSLRTCTTGTRARGLRIGDSRLPTGGWPIGCRLYGIKSKQIRIGELSRKGYLADDFDDAWNRYLDSPRLSETSETCET